MSLLASNIDYRQERERLQTFGSQNDLGERAANKGLYLKNNSEGKCVVACYFCDFIGELNEDYIKAHEERSSKCPFLKREPVGNVPLNNDISKSKFNTQLAWNQGYLTAYLRKHTFGEWPSAIKQQPEDLAKAGFLYRNHGDEVECYYCGAKVSGWEVDDDPWKKHAYSSRDCRHVLACKGPKFVSKAFEEMSAKIKEDAEKAAIVKYNDISGKGRYNKDSKTLCRLCGVFEYTICMIPCGHVYSCGMCAFSSDTCAICRSKINNRIRLKY